MDSQNLGEFSGKRKRKEEKVSILLESLFIQWIPVLASNPRTLRRNFRWSIIASRWLRRVHLPHRERLRDAFHCSKWVDPGRTKQEEEPKMEDAPKLLKIPKSECPDIWFRLPRHKWPKSWSRMEDPVVPLEKSVRSSFGRTVMGKAMWECSLENGWEKVPNWECLFVNRQKGLFLSVYVDDFEMAGKKQKTQSRLGKFPWKTLIWQDQQHSFTMFIWVALNENKK